MLNQSGITKCTATARKTILASTYVQFSLPIMVANTSVIADSEGKKIIKAGTPIAGDFANRDTAFTVASGADAVGLLLHDVDVTNGNANAVGLVFGFVDKTKLEESVVSLLNSEVLKAIGDKITFVA